MVRAHVIFDGDAAAAVDDDSPEGAKGFVCFTGLARTEIY